MTTGNFDGVHTGHVEVLARLNEIAKSEGLATALVTFRTHPRTFFYPGETHQSLTTFEEKIARLGDHVEYVIACDFDLKFSQQSTDEFLHILASRFSMRHYLTGHDHHIGRNREGTYAALEAVSNRENFSISRIEPLRAAGQTVSSTAIKVLLEGGDVESARLMLGYPYELSGTVVHGRQLGRKMGFPTANIVPPEGKVFPARGVYATICTVKGSSFMSMTNIGYNPTVGAENPLTIETNIFDFDSDIYDREASVHFIARIRDERLFSSVDELKLQLRADLRSTILLLQGRSIELTHLFDPYNA